MWISLAIGLAIAGCWGLADIQSSHVIMNSSHVTMSTTRSTVIAQGSGMLVLLLSGILFGGTALSLSVERVHEKK